MTQGQSLATSKTPFDSRALSGPFEGLARIHGAFPEWLRGRLVRTAPAIFEQNGWSARHWFDALGMLYSFEIEDASRVSWMQRLMNTEFARAASKGRAPYGTFDSGNGRSLLRRLVQPVPSMTDNANVNIVPMGRQWVAMTETPRQLIINPETLETQGEVSYQDALPRRLSPTAHPLYDAARKQVVNVGSLFGPRPELMVFSHDPQPQKRERHVIARVAMPRLPYVHSFGLSARSVVLVCHPFDVNPASLLWSNEFLSRFRWKPEQGTRLVVVDRASGRPSSFETEPMFVFHTVNAFDQDGETVIDLLAYPDATVVTEATRVDNMARGFPDIRASLVRLRMKPGETRAKTERLSDVPFEFPAISYRMTSGKRHRFVWGASIARTAMNGAQGMNSEIVRIDVDGGAPRSYSSEGFVLGEPVFVAAPNGSAEDDGVLLAVGSDAQNGVAKLVALDARDMHLIAEATIDVPLPLGFHGSFQRATAI